MNNIFFKNMDTILNSKTIHPYDRDLTIQKISTIDFDKGQVIPNSWYHEIHQDNGRPDRIATLLLADIVGFYRNLATCQVIDFLHPVPSIPVFITCAQSFVDKFCLPGQKIMRSLNNLEQRGFIRRQFDTPLKKKGQQALTATFRVIPVVDAVQKISYPL